MSNNCPDNSSKSLSIINANISVQFESTHLMPHVAIRAHRKSPPLATLVLLSSNDNNNNSNCPVYCDVLCIKMIHCTNRGCFTGIDQRSNYNTRRLAGVVLPGTDCWQKRSFGRGWMCSSSGVPRHDNIVVHTKPCIIVSSLSGDGRSSFVSSTGCRSVQWISCKGFTVVVEELKILII